MPHMSYSEMADMMQMDDTGRTGRLLLDQFELRDTAAGSADVWEANGWYGGDYNKFWLRTEGERVDSTTEDARVEVFWDHIFARWWSLQTGGREDFGNGPSRGWAAIGVRGFAPYWFEVEATAYVGDAGRTAARVKVEYELLLTQRLILQPEGEVNFYGKADPERHLGSGPADLDIGLRLRYEIRRQFAPYIGVAWTKLFGETATAAEAQGRRSSELQGLVGIRIWL
jgi:copper resistance protein B